MPDTPDQPRWVEYRPLASIKRAPSNPKRHDKAVIGGSIDRFGYTAPMVWDERAGHLVAGHGRLDDLELRADADDDPPDGILRGEGGEWLAPVVRGWASADDVEMEAYLVADNRATELGGWDMRDLTTMLGTFAERDDGLLEASGFKQGEYDDMLMRFAAPPSLEDLQRQVGPADPAATWPVLRFKINPKLKKRYDRLVAGLGGDDGDLFLAVVRWAEKGKKVSS